MESGILSGLEISKEISAGNIVVDPFTEGNLNPASLDLTLGKTVSVYRRWASLSSGPALSDVPGHSAIRMNNNSVLDMKEVPEVDSMDMDERGFILLPGILYLMHTEERIHTRKYVPILDGKSSIGRLGIKIHETAGFGDPGFDGQFTLEVTVMHPVRIYPGVKFCQIRFHSVQGEVRSYQDHRSNYTGSLARGPVPSRAWKMFRK